MFPLQLQICFILLYNQIMKRNNQIIRMNNQIFKILIAYIRLRLADVGSNVVLLRNFTEQFELYFYFKYSRSSKVLYSR